jgi:hypothetical protein
MTPRNVFSLAVLAVVGLLSAGQVRGLLADPTVWPPDDFVEYWAAARLTLTGQNPYDAAALLPLERAAGRATYEAVMMWNPPWALPAVLPLGLLPAREAQLLWLVVHLALMGYCGDRLWLMAGGVPARRWVGWAVAFGFVPTAFALSSGQITPLLLLGAVLYLECERRGWQYLSGAATVLVAIKPHLTYLLWVALAVDAVARGRWRAIVGGAGAGLACAALPVAFDPDVWHQYADALGNRPPAQWASPTFGTLFRMAFGEEAFGLQFVSVAAGLLWFAWYRFSKRNDWNLTRQLPLVLLVSFVTAPYGAWPFDMVLLLPAVFQIVLWGAAEKVNPKLPAGPLSGGVGSARAAVLAGLVAVNAGCLAMNLFQTGSFWFLWVSPAVLVLYVAQMKLSPRADSARSSLAVAVPA